jgi:iron transport multicopper oxidase
MNQGLAVTFVSFPDETQKLLTLPQTLIDHCEAQNIPASGNIVGLMSTTDFKGEPYGPWPQKLGWRPKGAYSLSFACENVFSNHLLSSQSQVSLP